LEQFSVCFKSSSFRALFSSFPVAAIFPSFRLLRTRSIAEVAFWGYLPTANPVEQEKERKSGVETPSRVSLGGDPIALLLPEPHLKATAASCPLCAQICSLTCAVNDKVHRLCRLHLVPDPGAFLTPYQEYPHVASVGRKLFGSRLLRLGAGFFYFFSSVFYFVCCSR
jgi:hypothetical protein